MVLGLPQLPANVTRESTRLRPTMLWSGVSLFRSGLVFATEPWSGVMSAMLSPFLESEEVESGKGKKEVEVKHVSFSYTFFHLIFALASR
ncbi:hypothetical protein Hanom_Chr07g00645711 [Helianthus anomalus]